MKLGFVSAILDGYSYEEMMATAKRIGYQCVEVACWPEAKAERRYAGVSHINCEKVIEDDSYAQHVLTVAKDNGVEISSLAFYPNTLDPDLKKRHDNVEHLKNVIRASHKLGINMVTTFIGRDQNRNFEDNLLIVKEVWPEILNLAKELGVKVAIENCPMLFGPDQWPGGQNLMTTPNNWRKIFEILDYDNLGINKGMFFENVVAQSLVASGRNLYFFSRKDQRSAENTMEIDFLVRNGIKICPVEVKSGNYLAHTSLDRFIGKYAKRLGTRYVVCTSDWREDGGITYLPIYMSHLL